MYETADETREDFQKGDYMIVIDYKDTRPIYEQIVERFKMLILKGVMREGEQMPSVRSLAMELSINPNTIQKAYAELERRGVTYCVSTKGSFVEENLIPLKEKFAAEQRANLIKAVKSCILAEISQDEMIQIVKELTEENTNGEN